MKFVTNKCCFTKYMNFLQSSLNKQCCSQNIYLYCRNPSILMLLLCRQRSGGSWTSIFNLVRVCVCLSVCLCVSAWGSVFLTNCDQIWLGVQVAVTSLGCTYAGPGHRFLDVAATSRPMLPFLQ